MPVMSGIANHSRSIEPDFCSTRIKQIENSATRIDTFFVYILFAIYVAYMLILFDVTQGAFLNLKAIR